MDIENEVPKYKKKKNKSPPQKSKHKHNYVDVIGKIHRKNGSLSYTPYLQCPECGKLVGNMICFEIDTDNSHCKRVLFKLEDIQTYYPNLEIVDVYR